MVTFQLPAPKYTVGGGLIAAIVGFLLCLIIGSQHPFHCLVLLLLSACASMFTSVKEMPSGIAVSAGLFFTAGSTDEAVSSLLGALNLAFLILLIGSGVSFLAAAFQVINGLSREMNWESIWGGNERSFRNLPVPTIITAVLMVGSIFLWMTDTAFFRVPLVAAFYFISSFYPGNAPGFRSGLAQCMFFAVDLVAHYSFSSSSGVQTFFHTLGELLVWGGCVALISLTLLLQYSARLELNKNLLGQPEGIVVLVGCGLAVLGYVLTFWNGHFYLATIMMVVANACITVSYFFNFSTLWVIGAWFYMVRIDDFVSTAFSPFSLSWALAFIGVTAALAASYPGYRRGASFKNPFNDNHVLTHSTILLALAVGGDILVMLFSGSISLRASTICLLSGVSQHYQFPHKPLFEATFFAALVSVGPYLSLSGILVFVGKMLGLAAMVGTAGRYMHRVVANNGWDDREYAPIDEQGALW